MCRTRTSPDPTVPRPHLLDLIRARLDRTAPSTPRCPALLRWLGHWRITHCPGRLAPDPSAHSSLGSRVLPLLLLWRDCVVLHPSFYDLPGCSIATVFCLLANLVANYFWVIPSTLLQTAPTTFVGRAFPASGNAQDPGRSGEGCLRHLQLGRAFPASGNAQGSGRPGEGCSLYLLLCC